MPAGVSVTPAGAAWNINCRPTDRSCCFALLAGAGELADPRPVRLAGE